MPDPPERAASLPETTVSLARAGMNLIDLRAKIDALSISGEQRADLMVSLLPVSEAVAQISLSGVPSLVGEPVETQPPSLPQAEFRQHMSQLIAQVDADSGLDPHAKEIIIGVINDSSAALSLALEANGSLSKRVDQLDDELLEAIRLNNQLDLEAERLRSRSGSSPSLVERVMAADIPQDLIEEMAINYQGFVERHQAIVTDWRRSPQDRLNAFQRLVAAQYINSHINQDPRIKAAVHQFRDSRRK